MEEKRATKVLQERTKEIKQRHFEERRAQAQRTKEKQERKKSNELKSAKIQIVSRSRVDTIVLDQEPE